MKKIKAVTKKKKKIENINFVPKDVQGILSSDKISEKYNEQKVLFKKTVLNNFAIFTGKYLCWWYLFFNKRPTTLSKRDANADVFLVILPNF